MLKTNAKEFDSVVKGKNFMTPQILSHWISGDYICELSQGTDFDNNRIFGVTVVNGLEMTHNHELSKVFNSRKEAMLYIRMLGE